MTSNKANTIALPVKFCVKWRGFGGNIPCAVTGCSPCDCPLGICFIRTKRRGSGLTQDEINDGWGTANTYIDTLNSDIRFVFHQATALPDSTIRVFAGDTWDSNTDMTSDLGVDSVVFTPGTYTVNYDSLPYGYVDIPFTLYE